MLGGKFFLLQTFVGQKIFGLHRAIGENSCLLALVGQPIFGLQSVIGKTHIYFKRRLGIILFTGNLQDGHH